MDLYTPSLFKASITPPRVGNKVSHGRVTGTKRRYNKGLIGENDQLIGL